MGNMRILMGNNTLAMLAGSETWTYALACQFKKMGHFVACYSPELGIISDKLREQGIRYDRQGTGDDDHAVLLCARGR